MDELQGSTRRFLLFVFDESGDIEITDTENFFQFARTADAAGFSSGGAGDFHNNASSIAKLGLKTTSTLVIHSRGGLKCYNLPI